MKTIGILGGLGPEATVDYYKEIIKAVNEQRNDGSLNYPEMVIYSVNMARFIGLLESGRQEEAADYLAACINKLGHAQVDFAAMSANTPHLLFENIQSKVAVPLVSIVEACAQKAKATGVKRCGLIGTRFTMEAGFFSDTFKKYDLEVVVPKEAEQQLIHEKLFTELELGIFKEETKLKLLAVVQEMIARDDIDALILGCTEFPVMFTDDSYLGIPFLNTTKIHVDKLLALCYNEDDSYFTKA